jgi:hypothetical protein
LALDLGGVLAVVEADAEDLAGTMRREELAGFHLLIGDLVVAEHVAGDGAGGAVGLQGGIGRAGRGEVADDLHEMVSRRKQTWR